jgi:serine/threonine protein kinase
MEKLGALDELVARTYAHQLWSALGACHNETVFHRDVKPENLLLAADWSLRVADFGLAAVGQSGSFTSSCGTAGYMAPEVVKSASPRGGHDPARADVWSATVVTFILAMGSPPITRASTSCWFYRQIQANAWPLFWKAHERFGPTLSPSLKAFIERGLNPRMLSRPTVGSMLEDDLFNETRMTANELQSFMAEAMDEGSALDSSFEEPPLITTTPTI